MEIHPFFFIRKVIQRDIVDFNIHNITSNINITFPLESELTIFLVSLFIHEDVGLHVPDKLVGEKLGGLGRPQDVLSHISHLCRTEYPSSLLLLHKFPLNQSQNRANDFWSTNLSCSILQPLFLLAY